MPGRANEDGKRRLDWDGCVNVRDLGGWPTASGRRTLFGAVVRSDNPAFLTPVGWAELVSYGIRTVVALRTIGAPDEEPQSDLIPSGVELVRVFIEDVTDQDFVDSRVATRQWGTPLYFGDALTRWPGMMAGAVRTVAMAPPGGVVISCGRGCDRTGFLAALLLHLVGVSEADIAADYRCSFTQWSAREPDYEDSVRDILAEHDSSVEAAFRSLLSLPIESFLTDAGLHPVELTQLTQRLVG